MPRRAPILIRVLSYIGRHRRLVAVQAPVLAISIALLVWRVDILEGLRGLPDLRPGWMLLGLVTFTASKAIHAYRWRVFLQHRDAPLRPLFGIFLIVLNRFWSVRSALTLMLAAFLVLVRTPEESEPGAAASPAVSRPPSPATRTWLRGLA